MPVCCSRRGPAPSWSRARSTASSPTPTLRDELIVRGRRRLQELTEVDASVTMLEAIGEIV